MLSTQRRRGMLPGKDRMLLEKAPVRKKYLFSFMFVCVFVVGCRGLVGYVGVGGVFVLVFIKI